MRIDSTVRYRWLAVLLEVTILCNLSLTRLMDSGYSVILVGCDGNEAKLRLEPHLKAAAFFAALASEDSSLARS